MKRMFLPILMLFLLVACERAELMPAENDRNLTTTVEFREDDAAIIMVNELIARVEEMMDAGAIGNGPGQSMLSKLRSIKSKLEIGQTEVALSKLDALVTHLEGLATDGTVDAGVIAGLIDDVELIECEADSECGPCADDTQAPYLVCVSQLEEIMVPEGISLPAVNFLAAFFDNCTPSSDLIISYSQDGSQTSRVFTCEDLEAEGNPLFITIWVTDLAGLQDFCQTTLLIQDPLGLCGAP